GSARSNISPRLEGPSGPPPSPARGIVRRGRVDDGDAPITPAVLAIPPTERRRAARRGSLEARRDVVTAPGAREAERGPATRRSAPRRRGASCWAGGGPLEPPRPFPSPP